MVEDALLMRIKKILLWVPVLVLLLGANVAFAGHFSDAAEKFFQKTCSRDHLNNINAFVCDLRERIDNIELIPGPKGDKGNKGDTGLKGDKGDQGEPGHQGPQGGSGATGPQGPQGEQGTPGVGQTLKIFDANGTELGPLVDFGFVNNQTFFYYAALQRLIEVRINSGRIGRPINLQYASFDCTGTPYINLSDEGYSRGVNTLFTSGGIGNHYILDRDTPEISVTWCSQQSHTSDNCSTPGGGGCGGTADLREVTKVAIPFDDPVPLPLRYGVN